MWVFERHGVVPVSESELELVQKEGRVGSVFKVLLRCVEREEEEVNVNASEAQLLAGIDCELWKRLPRDLASKIVFQHTPLQILVQQGWPAEDLIHFPPAQKHALFVGKAAFHNFSSSTRRVEIPGGFSSAQPLALSDQGLLVVACFSHQSITSPQCLACCHLPTSTSFELITLPTIGRHPYRCHLWVKRDKYTYAHAFHPEPASSAYNLILALGTHLFIFSSSSGKWRRFVEAPLNSMYYGGGIALSEANTLPRLFLPHSFTEGSGVTIARGSGERFKLRYSVVRDAEGKVRVVCCMRLDTVSGEWEVMPPPPHSILHQLNPRQMVVLGGDIELEQGVAVFEDLDNRRLLLGFVEPWEWLLSTQIITRGEMQLLLPSSKRSRA